MNCHYGRKDAMIVLGGLLNVLHHLTRKLTISPGLQKSAVQVQKPSGPLLETCSSSPVLAVGVD